jgi:hypothetical protein
MKTPRVRQRHAQVHRQPVGAPAAAGFIDLIFNNV